MAIKLSYSERGWTTTGLPRKHQLMASITASRDSSSIVPMRVLFRSDLWILAISTHFATQSFDRPKLPEKKSNTKWFVLLVAEIASVE